MASQEDIVQRMIDAGEPEENIATVIRSFKTKTQTSPETVVKPEPKSTQPLTAEPTTPQQETQEPSLLEKAYKGIFEAPEFITKPAHAIANWIDEPSLGGSPTGEGGIGDYLRGLGARTRGFAAGATEGAASLLSPANIISMGKGKLSSVAAKILGGGQVAHGAEELYHGNYAKGLGDVGFGILGLASPHASEAPESLPSQGASNTVASRVISESPTQSDIVLPSKAKVQPTNEFDPSTIVFGDKKIQIPDEISQLVKSAGLEEPESPIEVVGQKKSSNLSQVESERIQSNLNRKIVENDPEYVQDILDYTPSGEPGLAVNDMNPSIIDKTRFRNIWEVAYRGPDGKPIAVAKVVKHPDGTAVIRDFVGDKTKGLLYGRAVKSVGEKLREMGALTSEDTVSPDAINLVNRLKGTAENSTGLSTIEMQQRRSAAMDARNPGFKGIANDMSGDATQGNQSSPTETPGLDPRTKALLDKNSQIAKPLSTKYEPESKFLTGLANFSSKTTRSVLGFHIPGTAFSFHGMNEAIRNTIFGPDFNPISAVGRGMDALNYLARPNKANSYLQTNLADLSKAIEDGGLKVSTGDIGLNPIFKGNNFLSRGFNYLTDPKPLFGQVIPALKLKSYQGLLKQYRESGMEYSKAAKLAGYATNNILGGLNLKELERNPTTQKLFRIAAMAPDWLETNLRLGKGMADSIRNPLSPQNKVYQVGLANFLGSYTALNVLNAINNDGKFMYQNEPGHELDVAFGKDSLGRTRYFSPYGTAMDMFRIPIEIAHSAMRGNMGSAFTDMRSRTSLPLQFGTDLITNTNYAGQPMFNKTKYGKPITPLVQGENLANDAASHFLPIGINAASDYAQGKISPEQFTTQILQLPMKYKYPSKK